MQCDQMARVLFNIWPFTTMVIRTIGNKIWQSGFKICPIQNEPSKIWRNCRNFDKSGHTRLRVVLDRGSNFKTGTV